jgi:hypothetical protein
MVVYDSEGKEFTIKYGKGNHLTLKGVDGTKRVIHTSDLRYYTPHTTEVVEATKVIIAMLKSGRLTADQIKEIKEAL